jgi:hypothetical protein
MARARKKLKKIRGRVARALKKPKNKVETVMHEFKEGELPMGKSGKKVTNRKQAIAIGLSEARKAGEKVKPLKKKKNK